MKKIIALFVLMLGVSFTASAQKATKPAAAKPATTAAANTKEANIQKAAIEDAKALNEFVPLSNDQMQALKGLFVSKHSALADTNLTAERKALLSESIEAKINATLTPEQVTKLSQNPKLLKQLTGKQ